MIKEGFFLFPCLTEDQKFKVRKTWSCNSSGQVGGPDKVLRPFFHSHNLSLDLTLLPGRHGEPAGSPKNGMTAPRDRPARCLDPHRCRRPRPRSMPIRVRLVDRAASALSLGGEVRHRPERLPGAPDPAAARTNPAAAPAARHPVQARCRAAMERRRVPQDPSPCPGVGRPARLRRRVRPGCAERVRAHRGPRRADPRRAGGRRALPPPPAGGQQPGGPALSHGAGRPCHGGGLPGVPPADRGGSRPEDSGSGRQLQDAPRPEHPGAAGGEPSHGRVVFSAGLLAASQSSGTARGLSPAAGPSRAEQDRSTTARQTGSRLPVFAKSSGTGAGLLSRGRLPVYSCLHSETTTFDAISTPQRRTRSPPPPANAPGSGCWCWAGHCARH